MKKGIAFIFIATMMSLSCKKETNIAEWPYGVNYEVFVLSFADGNGDGKGDFKGLTQKLDYLQDLGVGGMWLMPIMSSPSYHKYDVVDYKSVDPQYGTLDEFKTLVNEAHKRKIKIIIDFILNHTSSQHPWFLEAIKGKDNPYRDYYVWADKDSIRNEIAKKEISLDSDNITQWHAANNDTLAEHYYGFFYGGMPDLNFDNPKVKEQIVDIGKFWLEEVGVDGFRLDAAKHIFPTDRAADNHNFWIWFRDEMTKVKPDVYLVGEVWSKAPDVAPYLKGLPALFNFDLGYAITDVVREGKDSIGLINTYKEINDFYKKSTSEYIDATFLKNHDQNRILSELGGSKEKQVVAASILMTLPGTPYVYYGEEIGMIGRKPDEYIREPFIWSLPGKDNAQTNWEEPLYSNDKTVVPLSDQLNDPSSIYSLYKRLIHYRNSSKALTYGDINTSPLDLSEVISFIRKDGDEELLALHNISDVEVTVRLGALTSQFDTIEFDLRGTSELENGVLILPAFSSVLLK